MPPLGRILKAAAAAVGGLAYVWIAAVRAIPGVRRRKAARRAAALRGGPRARLRR